MTPVSGRGLWRFFQGWLGQGLTPRQIAWTLAWGVVLGVFPVLGSTSLLCALAALLFRWNLPLIQSINWLVYPLQLILIIPFLRWGGRLFGAQALPASASDLVQMARLDPGGAFQRFWTATLQGIGVWCLVAPLAALVLFLLLFLLLKRIPVSGGTHV
ncbi:MAG TPA: DUF2062 domain-containing protein [bacterium]|nr:DUF2062 domain-containing protein [bacterium]